MLLPFLMTGSMLLNRDYLEHFNANDNLLRTSLNTFLTQIIKVTIVHEKATKSQLMGEVAFIHNVTEASEPLAVKVPSKFTLFLLNVLIMQDIYLGIHSLNVALFMGKI